MVSRRDLFKSVSALSLGLVGFRQGEDILVVGAGMAGLSVAQKLQAEGKNVTVLEARNRIGGRIWSEAGFHGGVIDLGASWIHGDRENPLLDLAKRAKAETVATDDQSDYPWTFDETGVRLSEGRLKAAYADYKALKKSAYAKQEDLSAKAPDESLGKFLAGRPEAVDPLVRHLLRTNIDGSYATDMEDLSLRAWDKGHWFGGEDLVVPGGMSQLVQFLARGIDVRLNAVVREIKRDKSGVVVTCADGRTFKASKVVVTLPLGVLKKRAVKFSPPLPDEKLRAIDRLGAGTFDKVYVAFDTAFWPKDATWIEHAGKDPAVWPMFFNLQKYGGRPVLAAFVVGSFAKSVEAKTDAEVVADVTKVLKLAADANGWKMTPPIQTRITRWGQDPYALGSYSHVPVGASLEDFDKVGSTVDGQLFFAGEATSSSDYMTAHAAHLSGLREAKRILG